MFVVGCSVPFGVGCGEDRYCARGKILNGLDWIGLKVSRARQDGDHGGGGGAKDSAMNQFARIPPRIQTRKEKIKVPKTEDSAFLCNLDPNRQKSS